MFEFRIHRASASLDTCPCDDAYYVEERRGWFISFQDMSELMAFIHHEGMIILDKDTLWIYDDYME